MRVLVTGSAGHLGEAAYVEQYLRRGWRMFPAIERVYPT
jgi:hypothetical protein